jgi:hypothetical protein
LKRGTFIKRKIFFIRKAPFEALSHSALFSGRFSRLRTSECHREASLVTNVTGLREIEKMRQPHEEFENSRSKCEKAAPNPADYLGEIPLDYRARQQNSIQVFGWIPAGRAEPISRTVCSICIGTAASIA